MGSVLFRYYRRAWYVRRVSVGELFSWLWRYFFDLAPKDRIFLFLRSGRLFQKISKHFQDFSFRFRRDFLFRRDLFYIEFSPSPHLLNQDHNSTFKDQAKPTLKKSTPRSTQTQNFFKKLLITFIKTPNYTTTTTTTTTPTPNLTPL